jgi:glyoxylase-like metal-dependent hydrolase (beta-lactamase superfamily II)
LSTTYDLFAIRYGHHHRTASHNFIGGDPHDGPMPLDYFVWAIVGQKWNFVFDTGFDAARAAKRQRTLLRPVGDGLRMIGLDPDQVEDVIISHMHFDHAGNHTLFPRARYHVQDTEMNYCTGRCMCHHALRIPFEVDDVTDMVGKIFADRPPIPHSRKCRRHAGRFRHDETTRVLKQPHYSRTRPLGFEALSGRTRERKRYCSSRRRSYLDGLI